MKLFGLQYRLAVGLGALAAVIESPIRCKFDISKSADGSTPNKAKFQVYGLAPNTRQKIVKNPTDQKYVPVSLEIGYEDKLAMIFKGNVDRSFVQRDGADVFVDMECLDGGFDLLNTFITKTVDTNQIVIDQIVEEMPNTSQGKLTPRTDIIRPRVINGRALDVIKATIREGESWYIDNEQLFIMKRNEVVARFAPLVSAQTGLLSIQDDIQEITFTAIINPSLRLGGLCKIESSYAPHLDGVYKITAIAYKGDTRGSDRIMTATAIRAEGARVL